MRAFTRPLWLTALGEDAVACRALEAVPLRLRSEGPVGASESYDEAWLQRLIHAHPALLPIELIEAAFHPATPICMELPVPSGFVDNLMITPDGGVILVETKLWRNPQARREVVAQVLDYAKDLSGLDYEGLQARVRLARKEPGADLHRLASPAADPMDEATFVDAVSRNLRLGRFLVLICGDGVQEGTEELTAFLQRHVGLHFTLGLVEMSLWRDPASRAILVQPRVLARTLQIERAVVRVEDGVALRPSNLQAAPAAGARPVTITEEAFFEALGADDPGRPDRLKAFLRKVEALGVYPEVRRNLSLKWSAPDGRAFHLGSIYQDGKVGTDFVQWSPYNMGRLDLGTAYQEALARLLPGGVVKKTPKELGWYVVVDGRNPSIDLLLQHEDAWIAAMAEFIQKVSRAMEDAGAT